MNYKKLLLYKIIIGSSCDNLSKKTRAVVYEPEPDAEWATQEMQIAVAE